MKFKCRKSIGQEYGCQVCAKPFFASRLICFDKCLADELFYLWDIGIETTGCCCGGHVGAKDNMSYIGVKGKYIKKMKELGYVVRDNESRPGAEDSFIPKMNFMRIPRIATNVKFYWLPRRLTISKPHVYHWLWWNF